MFERKQVIKLAALDGTKKVEEKRSVGFDKERMMLREGEKSQAAEGERDGKSNRLITTANLTYRIPSQVKSKPLACRWAMIKSL